jgi:GntR family transcriptional repressor for pyruvate dehydrogenase complex
MAVAESLDTGKRQTVVEAISQALIRYIAANELKGGDRLPSERELVKMAGASRLPLREAICVLKGLGILEAKHGKGIFVKPLDLAALFGMLSPLLKTQAKIDLRHLFEARLHLESSIAELAAAHRSDENLQVLQQALEGMEASLADRPAYVERDMAFHQELARSTGNPIFHVFMASITDLLGELQASYQDDGDIRRQAVAEHQAILDAVRHRDGSRARTAMEKHLQNATQRV